MVEVTKVTKEFRFCAAHRLHEYDGLCANLHGHNYRAEVTLTAMELDGMGMVLDFGIIKARIGQWIDKHWDHALLLNANDPLASVEWDRALGLFFKTFLFEGGRNPTAEIMAQRLWVAADGEIAGLSGVRLACVRIYDTDSSWAEVIGG